MAVIGFDIDDTVANGAEVFIPSQNKYFNTNYTIEEVAFELSNKKMHQIYNTTPEMFEKYVYDSGPDQLPKLKVIPNAVELVNKLFDDGHIIYFVTARPENNTKELTIKWLNDNGFKYNGVFHSETKVEICKELGIEIFVDDYSKVIKNTHLNDIKSILIDVPKNKYIDFDKGIYKAKDINEAYNIIIEILKEKE